MTGGAAEHFQTDWRGLQMIWIGLIEGGVPDATLLISRNLHARANYTDLLRGKNVYRTRARVTRAI